MNQAEEWYKKALKISIDDLWAINPVRLAISLNYALLLHDFKDQQNDAIFLSETMIEAAFSFLDDMRGEDIKNLDESIQLLTEMRSNLEMWYKK